jgi:hypothetical protein
MKCKKKVAKKSPVWKKVDWSDSGMIVGVMGQDGYYNIKHPTWVKYKPIDPKTPARHGIGKDSTIVFYHTVL